MYKTIKTNVIYFKSGYDTIGESISNGNGDVDFQEIIPSPLVTNNLDWFRDNWNTPNNAFHTVWGEGYVQFDTFECAPYPIFNKLLLDFINLEFVCYYTDHISNCGIIDCTNGIVSHWQPSKALSGAVSNLVDFRLSYKFLKHLSAF